MVKRLSFVLVMMLLALSAGWALAQDGGGQVWVRAFEDRNGNGVRDAGEPLLTRDVSVSLMNADGVVIASGLLDESPNATQGMIGFQYLEPGRYTVVITSPDLTATTPDTIETTIESGTLPTVFEYGGQRDAAAADGTGAPAEVTVSEDREQIARLAIAGAGAAVVVGGMTLLGLAIYALMMRSSRPRRSAAHTISGATTGGMTPVAPENSERLSDV